MSHEAERHEGRDARPRAVLLTVAAGLGAVVVLSVAAAGYLGWLATAVGPLEVPAGPPPQDDGATPGLREEVAETLGGYEWVDRERGLVRIPIDAAMALLAERGWPSPGADGAGR